MYEVICSGCGKVIDYNFDLAIPDQPSHGWCDRCAFVAVSVYKAGRNPIKRFIAKRWAKKIYDVANEKKGPDTEFLVKQEYARQLESMSKLEVKGGIYSF